MKSLHVIASIAPRYGGTTRAVLEYCRALKDLGMQADILCTDADGPHARFPEKGMNPYEVEGVTAWVHKRDFSESWKYSRALGEWLSNHVSEYDVIHIHGAFSYSTHTAFRTALSKGTPVVFSPHGMLAPYSLGHSFGKKYWYLKLFGKGFYERAALCLGTTPQEAQELKNLLPNANISCIPLGVEEAAFTAPRTEGLFRSRYGIPLNAPLVLFLSRIHRKKGILDILIPTLKNLDASTHLAIVGEEDPHDAGHLREIKEAVQKNNLEKRIHFCGGLYANEKWAAYDDADCYVLPSHHENFGLTVGEALTRGVPCVVSKNVQSASSVLECKSGAVIDLTALAATKEIEKILHLKKTERKELAERSHFYAKQRLTWEFAASSLAERYASLSGNSQKKDLGRLRK